MATLPVTSVTRAGVDVVASAAPCSVGGDVFPNTGEEVAVFTNASGAPITVSFAIQAKIDGQAVAPKTMVVAAASTVESGRFRPGIYNDLNDLLHITYSSVTDLFVKIVKAAQP